jgi:hypothetical protein
MCNQVALMLAKSLLRVGWCSIRLQCVSERGGGSV